MRASTWLWQVDNVEGLQHGGQARTKIGSTQDGTVITVQGHGIDASPVWRHTGMPSGLACSLCCTAQQACSQHE